MTTCALGTSDRLRAGSRVARTRRNQTALQPGRMDHDPRDGVELAALSGSSVNSTRRFLARPAADRSAEAGCSLRYPSTRKRGSAMPRRTR
jgi:hypothetical protein